MAEGNDRKDQRPEVVVVKARLLGAAAWLHRRAENVIAVLLGVMFVAFLVQIGFRYLFNFPVGWTSELTVAAWLWLVLWGSAFVLKESEEIRFDLIYSAVGPRTRRIMAIVALSLLGLPIGHAMIGGSVLYLWLAGLTWAPPPSSCSTACTRAICCSPFRFSSSQPSS